MLRYNSCKGEITVFLSLISLVVCAFIYMVIVHSRSNAYRLEAESIVELSLESVFAEYDKALFDKYGLLFVDTSYNGTMDGKDESFLCKFVQYLGINSALTSDISYLSSDVSTIHHAGENEYESVLDQIEDYMVSKGISPVEEDDYLDEYILLHSDLYEDVTNELLWSSQAEHTEYIEYTSDSEYIQPDKVELLKEYLSEKNQYEKVSELVLLIEDDMKESCNGSFDFESLIDMVKITVYMEDKGGKVYECIRQLSLTDIQ